MKHTDNTRTVTVQLWLVFMHVDYCSLSLPGAHWLRTLSSLVRRSFVVCPASVTSPLTSTIWGFRSYKPNIFSEDMILATCHHHHIFIWWSSYYHMMIIISSYNTKHTTYALFLQRRGLKDIKYDSCASSVHHLWIISASSAHHRWIINASSVHHPRFKSASSVYHPRLNRAS